VANPPKIFARRRHSSDGHLSSAFESAQRVDTRRIFLPSSAEIQTGDGQDLLIINDSCISNCIVFDSVYLKRSFIFSSSAFAVAFHKRFNAISIDAALAGEDIRGGAGPEKKTL
jgi:hypothetical protein